MLKVYFVTFGGGTQDFHMAVNRIVNQAKEFNIFEKIFGLTEINLKNDRYFWEKHGSFILNNPRFYGYAIWKSYIMIKLMEYIDDGDILFYSDCGCELNIRGKTRMLEYIKLVEQYDTLAFNLNYKEKMYTKTDLFNFINASDELKDSNQIESGMIFLKKTNNNLELLNEMFNLQTVNNYHYTDDTPSLEPNDKSFIEHRHDQSCFSVLMKKYNNFTIPDETYFHPDWNKGIKYPIWAVRNKTDKSIFN